MKISIIIPCYNAKDTIKRCLDSVLNQTYKDIEIILINDASTDKTLDILNEYKNLYKKLIIINHEENKGISYSRNEGIKKASGELISFIDSDDYMNSNMIEVMVNKLREDSSDLVICNYNKYVSNSMFGNEYKFTNGLVNFKSSPNLILDINLSPWNKLYKKSLLKNNYFPEGLKYEDAIVVVKALKNAQNISIINEKLYNYVVHSNSETTIVDEKVYDILMISELIYKELCNYIDHEYLEAFMIRNLFRYTIQQKNQISKKVKYDFVNKVFDFLNNKFPKWRKNKIYNKRNFFKKVIEKNKILTKIYITF